MSWSPSFVERCSQTKEQCKQRLQAEIDITIDNMFAFFMDELGLAVKDAVSRHVQSLSSLPAESHHFTESHQQDYLPAGFSATVHGNVHNSCTKFTKHIDILSNDAKARCNLSRQSQLGNIKTNINTNPGQCANERNSTEVNHRLNYDVDEFECDCSICQGDDLFDESSLDEESIKEEIFDDNDEEVYLSQNSGILNSDSSSSSINQKLNHLDLNLSFGHNIPDRMVKKELLEEAVEMPFYVQTKRARTCIKTQLTQPEMNYSDSNLLSSYNFSSSHVNPTSSANSKSNAFSSSHASTSTVPFDHRQEHSQNNFQNDYQHHSQDYSLTNRKPQFTCEISNCNKTFRLKCLLKQHQLSHVGVRPFQCQFNGCGKWFRNRAHLHEHERIHRGVRPYRCKWEGCHFDATDRSTTINHIRGIHFNLPRSRKEQKERNIIDYRDPKDYVEVVAELL